MKELAKPILSLKEHIDMLDGNGVTASNVAQEHTDSENNCDLNKTLSSDSFAEANVDTDLDKTLEYSVHKDNDSETFDTFRADDVNDAKSQTADTSQTDDVEVENSSESDTAELNVNKNTTKIYTHTKRTKPTLPHQPRAPVIDNTDIDMIEDTTNAELINLSENLAETLVIMDLEELMNAQDQSDTDAQTSLPARPMSPKGTFTYSFRGIRRKQSTPMTAGTNKYRCPACPSNWDTRGAMCEHYRLSHPPLPCDECSMTFTLPLTLARHSYKHRDRPYSCDTCKETFAFNSELSQHACKAQRKRRFLLYGQRMWKIFCENRRPECTCYHAYWPTFTL